MTILQIVDWIAILTIPVSFIIWCIGNIIINCQSIKEIKIWGRKGFDR